tara:strand:+ start:136 stop:390 length:255 start_codon:yes stop_codon:yes gene_type:complete
MGESAKKTTNDKEYETVQGQTSVRYHGEPPVLSSFNYQQATANHSKIFLNLIKNRIVIPKTKRTLHYLDLIYRAVNAKVSPSST